jgi:DNA-binding protein H-NS
MGYVASRTEADRSADTVKVLVSPKTQDYILESPMHKLNLEQMPLEELWGLHERIAELLSEKIVAEKRELERRLAQLAEREIPGSSPTRGDRVPRRAYPKVLPKYFNPKSSSETWSGRGKRPRWLTAALQNGHELREFEIGSVKKPLQQGRSARGAHH